MYCISDQQIDFIRHDISRHGIKIESLQQNLLDHICIIIEENLEEHGDFEKFYASAIKTFYKEELREIEEETIFLLHSRGPHILLGRNQFFLLLFIIFIGPFIAYDIFWMMDASPAGSLVLPAEIWETTFVFALFPLLVLLVLFTTPEKLDPLIPRKSKILLGIKPFIKIIHAENKLEIRNEE
jgi:hypothetical protein